MPYKDKVKDREWHRLKMWGRRHNVTPDVTPDVTPLRPHKTQTLDNLRQTIKNIEDRTKAPQRPSGEASLPLFDPAIYKPGDRVLVKPPYGKKLVEIVVPELDAGGQPVPNYD